MGTRQYIAAIHQCNCSIYINNKKRINITVVSQMAVYIFDAWIPQLMGMVLHPYFLSPSMSSISLTASRIREVINANPTYKKVTRIILRMFTSAGLKKKRASHQVTTSTVQAVNREIRILPD